MDLASIIGIILCFSFFVFGVAIGDEGIVGMKYFWDFPSIVITLGGASCAILTSNSIKDFVGGLKSITLAFKVPVLDTPQIIQKIIDLSNVARKEGLLSLEEAAGELDDPFMKKGILLIVDGTDPELVRAIMETELVSIEGRHKQKIGFWQDFASMGPAWGMIGTLIGLILMLQNMGDPGAIGPAMSTALVTTFYGSMLANWICIPVSAKLKSNSDAEVMLKEVMIEGLLSIQAGENPRVIEEKLKSFLAPSDRKSIGDDGGEGNE